MKIIAFALLAACFVEFGAELFSSIQNSYLITTEYSQFAPATSPAFTLYNQVEEEKGNMQRYSSQDGSALWINVVVSTFAPNQRLRSDFTNHCLASKPRPDLYILHQQFII